MRLALMELFFRRRLRQKLRWAMFAVLFVSPLVLAAVRGADAVKSVAPWLALVVGSGSIGEERSLGAWSWIFTHPISRADYVLTRWAGTALVIGVASVLYELASLAVVHAFGTATPLGATSVIFVLASSCLTAVAMAATLTLLSIFLPGSSDGALVALLVFVTVGIREVMTLRGWGSAANLIYDATRSVLIPQIKLDAATLAELFGVLSNAAIVLVIAVAVMNRVQLAARA